MQLGRGGRTTWRATIIFSVLALTITLGTWYVGSLPRARVIVLFLQLEGTALLACALVPQDPLLSRTMKGWWVWFRDRSMASFVGFNKFEFYTGLLLLAVAAVVSVLMSP